MNMRWMIIRFCMVVLLGGVSSCIHKDFSDCPADKYMVKVSVKDKNYANINSFPQLAAMAEDSPFRVFAVTIYYTLSDAATGNLVKESAVESVSGNDTAYFITFEDIPEGEYTLTVWSNVTTDYPAGILHQEGKEHTDIYMATRMLKFDYSYQTAEVALERTKGELLLLCKNFPPVVTGIGQSITNVYQKVDANFNYSGSTRVDKKGEFQPALTTLLAPSAEGRSKLKLSFYTDDAQKSLFLELPEMDLTVKRNEISAIAVDFKEPDGIYEVWTFINGQWTMTHRLDIE